MRVFWQFQLGKLYLSGINLANRRGFAADTGADAVFESGIVKFVIVVAVGLDLEHGIRRNRYCSLIREHNHVGAELNT